VLPSSTCSYLPYCLELLSHSMCSGSLRTKTKQELLHHCFSCSHVLDSSSILSNC
jgi:hypothetical protein